jgi:lysozyme
MKTILILALTIIALINCSYVNANSTSIMLKSEEGFRSAPYVGNRGYVHIGYGYKLHDDTGLDPDSFLIEISEEVASLMLDTKLEKIESKLSHGRHGKTFQKQTQARKDVLISMAYQMGYSGLMSFTNMWSALEAGDMAEAAVEALDSLWAIQTPERAQRHALTLLIGIPYEY